MIPETEVTMICPKCGNEKGDERACPVCGADSTSENEPNQNVQEQVQKRDSNAIKRITKQLAVLELRTKLIMLLMCGYFVLQLLMLLLIAIK